ncbi:hypothetical protein [Paenibacillus methanolicus]|uniref:Ferritin-like domain-containing protein n=1 Tax=Paenibacillus methanolicus TaxID=582686 RepID=A0A5S5BR88_9BACL|nr:hypothetical protein [Paenibacillus methanolicus]TYP69507.1 hypothetical protein BCM02_11423 [Paenibacillus methanolicus]
MDVHYGAWSRYYRENKTRLRELDWDDPYRLDEAEYKTIAGSIQQFQIGESSEGKYLIEAAKRYLAGRRDQSYLESLILFIQEEQRHARELARFMERQHIPRIRSHWVDGVFRKLRRFASLEQSITVLLTAEIIASVYYIALRQATKSPLLIGICDQILADEAKHVEYQCVALGEFARRRAKPMNRVAGLLRRVLLTGTLAVVWFYHGKVFRAGGYRFASFCQGAFAVFDEAECRINA